MDPNLAIVFVSMALTVAITRLAGETDPTGSSVAICLYFILRRVNYYIIDKKFALMFDSMIKPGREFERIIETYLGVITLFCFLISGFYVIDPKRFFWWTCLALIFNVLWLILVRFLIDGSKDRNKVLRVSELYRNSIVENLAEVAVCLAVAIVLTIEPNHEKLPFQTVASWSIGLGLGILGFIMFFDLVVHRHFLSSEYDPAGEMVDPEEGA
jgi:hypothetical protein